MNLLGVFLTAKEAKVRKEVSVSGFFSPAQSRCGSYNPHPHLLGAKKPLDKIFNVKTQPIPASEESVNKLAFKMNGEGIYKVTSGPAMRIILDFADVEASVSVLPTGQSGNRFSKHYADQADLYAKGRYRPQLMNEAEIRDKAKSTLMLLPK